MSQNIFNPEDGSPPFDVEETAAAAPACAFDVPCPASLCEPVNPPLLSLFSGFEDTSLQD